jgi:hypothetical protein
LGLTASKEQPTYWNTFSAVLPMKKPGTPVPASLFKR